MDLPTQPLVPISGRYFAEYIYLVDLMINWLLFVDSVCDDDSTGSTEDIPER